MGADGVAAEWEPKPCAGLGDLFFSEDPAEQSIAKTICQGCAHGVWCAEQALKAIASGETGGVWAGMTLHDLEEGLRDVDRRRARTAGHPSAITAPGSLSELREEPGVDDRHLPGVPDRPDPAPGA